jgi:hypothetical protein
MNWIDALVKQHTELESPQSFWRWAALASISAVVKDNIWMDRAKIFKTYPNIYVMLHAESGLKKGPPVSMAKQLVQKVGNTRIITGRSSIQGILKEMGSTQSQPGGKVPMKSVVFICSSELSSSIVEDKVATRILTDLYDRSYNEGEWKSLLKMESFQLKDPTISMLTATNEAMAEDFFTKSAIQGGYFARTFIIYEKENATSNSLTYPLEDTPNYKDASEYLKELAKLNGPFAPFADTIKSEEFRYPKKKLAGSVERIVYFNEVGLVYDDWYDTFKEMVKNQEIKDDTGTMNRFGDSVLKVAMLMSLAEQPKLEITLPAMHSAIAECEKLIGNARRTTLGKQGISSSSLLKSLIIMELLNRENHSVSRVVLMKKMWMHYENSEEFDNMMLSFDHAGMIKTGSVGNQIIYTMPDEQVDELKKFMSGKSRR